MTLPNRESLLTFALILLLAVLTIAAAFAEGRETPAIPLDSASTAPDGANALYRWFEALGFSVSDAIEAEFKIPEGASLSVVLEPSSLSATDLDVLEAWVEDGGYLLFAGEFFGATPLLNRFDIDRGYAGEPLNEFSPTFPLQTNPAVNAPLPFDVSGFFEPGFDDFVPLVSMPQGPVVMAFDYGNGQIVLSSTTEPFTNAGLKVPGAGEFILNLVDGLPEVSQVWFDEWHHGRRPPIVQGPGGPGDWLRRTPAGRALLFSTMTIFLWIAVSGRAFGRAVRPNKTKERRAPLEYVTAIANLNQRAGNRAHLLNHYHDRLKRHLGKRYRIDTRLTDTDFMAELAQFDPEIDLERLKVLLADLQKPQTSESEMVRLAGEVVGWVEHGL